MSLIKHCQSCLHRESTETSNVSKPKHIKTQTVKRQNTSEKHCYFSSVGKKKKLVLLFLSVATLRPMRLAGLQRRHGIQLLINEGVSRTTINPPKKRNPSLLELTSAIRKREPEPSRLLMGGKVSLCEMSSGGRAMRRELGHGDGG